MELSEQFTQLSLPGVDLDKATKEAREAAIKQNYVSLDSWSSIGANSLGRAKARELRRVQPGTPAPTQDVVNMLRLSAMPVTDLRDAGTVVVSDSGSSFSSLGSGTAGTHDLTSGYVTYRSKFPTEQRRGVMVHELAHVLQHDMTQAHLENELHKVHRSIWERMAQTPDDATPQDMSGGLGVLFNNPDKSKTREHGEKQLSRYAHFDIGAYRHLEAPSLHITGTPIYEGSAEGYRQKYQGKADFSAIYSPDYFTNKFGGDAGQAYQTAFDYSHLTGKPVTDSIIMKATRLAGVLASDLNLKGERVPHHDMQTVHRMTTHLLQKEMGHTELPHEKEFQERTKAVEGEHIQLSMFPEIAPDIDQFGNPAGAPVQRSPRGEALLAGMRTELPREQTIEQEARRQKEVSWSRSGFNKNSPMKGMTTKRRPAGGTKQLVFDPGTTDLQDRLKKHVAEKAKRDEVASMSSSGELHPEINNWINKLVYGKKIEYAKAYAMARQTGGALPAIPTGLKDEHAEATRTKIDQIIKKHGIV